MTRSAPTVMDAVLALDHPTAEEVYDELHRQGSRLSRATVYRNLGHLADRGRLRVRDLGQQKRYDPHVEPHVHIHDVESGRLVDVPMTPALKAALDDLAAGMLETQEDCVIELKGRLRK